MAPFETWNDPLNGPVFRGGALELGAAVSWQLMMGLDLLVRRHRGDPQALGRAIYLLAKEMDALEQEGYWSLPLREFGPLKQQDIAPYFFMNFAGSLQRGHEILDPMTIVGKHENVTVPTLNTGGWYDIFLQDTLSNFTIMRTQGSTPEARQSKLLIGPWTHGGVMNPIGEMNFGFRASGAIRYLQRDYVSCHYPSLPPWLKLPPPPPYNHPPLHPLSMLPTALPHTPTP